MWRSLPARALTAAILLLVAPGCAPLGVASAIDEAEEALATATSAGAEARAAYPWWSARAYLELARAAEGRADYEGASTFARRARDFAVKAAKQSAARPEAPASPGGGP